MLQLLGGLYLLCTIYRKQLMQIHVHSLFELSYKLLNRKLESARN